MDIYLNQTFAHETLDPVDRALREGGFGDHVRIADLVDRATRRVA
jgi:hypothetical protein